MALAALVSLAATTGFGSPDQKVHYNVTANASMKDVPPAFQKAINLQASKDKFGFETSNENAKLVLNFDLKPDPNNTKRLDATGSGVVHVDSATFPFQITDARLYQATLNNGQTFIFGVLDGKIQTKKGEDDSLAIGVTFIPETDQKFFTFTSGTLEHGLSAIAFGEKFTTEEMINLQCSSLLPCWVRRSPR